MKSEAKTIINIIHTKKIELENKLKKANENEDETAINKFQNQINVLEYIQNKLYHNFVLTLL